MALGIRIQAFLSLVAAAGLLLIAIFALAQPGTHFIGPALIAGLAGGIALTWGISLFQKTASTDGAALYRPAVSET